MNDIALHQLKLDPQGYLSVLQPLLALPRETVPQLTATETRKTMAWAAGRLHSELIEIKGTAPTFLLLPPDGVPPTLTLFASWHAESAPVTPAALEGAERLALAATLAALAAITGTAGAVPVSVVAAPAASHGSLVLLETLTGHRERLRASAAFWPRVIGSPPARRRVFLGARGRVVLGFWGEGANPYSIRDEIVRTLSDEAYGPRPLDFELLRKLADSTEALDLLEEAVSEPAPVPGDGETRLRNALFAPRGQVLAPPVSHPDRPRAWLVFETAENMDAAEIRTRVESLAGGARVDLAEAFSWDRLNIHHPSVRSLVPLAKSRSAGPEIWPMAPWTTPSGVFTRALGVPLAEWGVPIPRSGMIRIPTPEIFESIQSEVAELVLRAAALLKPAE